MLLALIIAVYVIGLITTTAAIGNYCYWHKSPIGEWSRYDEHEVIMGFGGLLWPFALPLLMGWYLATREPRSIRKRRELQQLEEFARREGL